jgi:membrane associated rhomboid family serine protease
MFIPLKDENPTSRVPVVTFLLIAINAAVFLYQALSPQGLEFYVLKMGTIPYEITHFTTVSGIPRLAPPLTLLTSLFLHGSLFHLLGNMLYLWIFGNNIEDYLGPARFTLFYLISGLGAGLTHILFHPNSTIPVIGASGAVAGILGAYLLLYPSARVITLIFIWIVPVPAALLLMLWFLGQIMNVGLGGGVAWFAHIGGFLLGVFLITRFRRPFPPGGRSPRNPLAMRDV